MRKLVKYTLITVIAVILLGLGAWAVYRATHGPGSYVGLTETEAIERAQDRGLLYRIVERDGEPSVITDDIKPDRINFEIDSGRVIRAEFY